MPWYEGLHISLAITTTVTTNEPTTVTIQPGASDTTVLPAKATNAAAHTNSSGRDIRKTLQNRKK